MDEGGVAEAISKYAYLIQMEDGNWYPTLMGMGRREDRVPGAKFDEFIIPNKSFNKESIAVFVILHSDRYEIEKTHSSGRYILRLRSQ